MKPGGRRKTKPLTDHSLAITSSYDTANIRCRQLQLADLAGLHIYLLSLLPATRQRFGPHSFDTETLYRLYTEEPVAGFGAFAGEQLVAYAIIRKGLVPHDRERLMSYPYPLYERGCCTFAPSVADDWQGRGLGGILLQHILEALSREGCRQLVLWGGVQSGNIPAQRYYQKAGFKKLGSFEYYGSNDDMVLELPVV